MNSSNAGSPASTGPPSAEPPSAEAGLLRKDDKVKIPSPAYTRSEASLIIPWLQQVDPAGSAWAESHGSESDVPETTEPSSPASEIERHRKYRSSLSSAGIHLQSGTDAGTEDCRALCRDMFEMEQAVPANSLFEDDVLLAAYNMVMDANRTSVQLDIFPQIVPRVEILYPRCRARHLEHLLADTFEKWTSATCLVPGRPPRPDYTVGFGATAFTDGQLRKLHAFVRGHGSHSPVMPRLRMYFPFFTCHFTSAWESLNVADNQNAHSASFAVNGLLALYRATAPGAAMELHRKMLAFSVSHDASTVRIYGHYALLDQPETQFYCQLLKTVTLFEDGGRDRWVAYRFIMSLYERFCPLPLERIRAGIDRLPEGDIDVAGRPPVGKRLLLPEENDEAALVVKKIRPSDPSEHRIERGEYDTIHY